MNTTIAQQQVELKKEAGDAVAAPVTTTTQKASLRNSKSESILALTTLLEESKQITTINTTTTTTTTTMIIEPTNNISSTITSTSTASVAAPSAPTSTGTVAVEYLDFLPTELCELLLEFCDLPTVKVMGQTCKFVRNVVESNPFFWKNKFDRDFSKHGLSFTKMCNEYTTVPKTLKNLDRCLYARVARLPQPGWAPYEKSLGACAGMFYFSAATSSYQTIVATHGFPFVGKDFATLASVCPIDKDWYAVGKRVTAAGSAFMVVNGDANTLMGLELPPFKDTKGRRTISVCKSRTMTMIGVHTLNGSEGGGGSQFPSLAALKNLADYLILTDV